MAIAPQLIRATLIVATAGSFASCGAVTKVRSAGDFAASDFCADLLTRAYPEASFDIVNKTSKATSLSGTIVEIDAHRTDAPAGTEHSTDVAVECSFDHNVLTGFRWTKGPFMPRAIDPESLGGLKPTLQN